MMRECEAEGLPQNQLALYKTALCDWTYIWWRTRTRHPRNTRLKKCMNDAMKLITTESKGKLYERLTFPYHLIRKRRRSHLVFHYYNIRIPYAPSVTDTNLLQILSLYQAIKFTYTEYARHSGREELIETGENIFQDVYNIWTQICLRRHPQDKRLIDTLLAKFRWHNENEIVTLLNVLTGRDVFRLETSDAINTIDDIIDVIDEFMCYQKENVRPPIM